MIYSVYVMDTETTSLDPVSGDVIELSILRVNDGVQKTWHLKPKNFAGISTDALRINGHKYEDITHQTAYGRETYLPAEKVIVDVENWVEEDNSQASDRCIVGQNIQFDKLMLEHLWKKCGAEDSFPFGRRMIDTMQFEILLDMANESRRDSYSLSSIIKKYGIKNDKAHTAAADVKATTELFAKQMDYLKQLLKAQ